MRVQIFANGQVVEVSNSVGRRLLAQRAAMLVPGPEMAVETATAPPGRTATTRRKRT